MEVAKCRGSGEDGSNAGFGFLVEFGNYCGGFCDGLCGFGSVAGANFGNGGDLGLGFHGEGFLWF